jgi:hypothetical protein
MPLKNAFALALAVLLTLSSCAYRSESVSDLGAAFQKTRDFRTLTLLLPHLRLGLPRAEAERILGKPDYSPIEGQFYYASSDRRTEEGVIVGLILEYRRTDAKSGALIESGKLESIYLGPIAE